MQVMRFMSAVELEKFRAGELLENLTDHHMQNGQKTESVGFCFLDYDEYDEQYAYHFLSGIVSTEVVAIFEVPDEFVKGLKKGVGRFAQPGGKFHDSMNVTEYFTERYHNKALKLVKYCDDFHNKFADNRFDRVFDFKGPAEPIRKELLNKPVTATRSDSPEGRLLDAVIDFIRHRVPELPVEVFEGFTLAKAPMMHLRHDMNSDRLVIEGLEFTRPGGIGHER